MVNASIIETVGKTVGFFHSLKHLSGVCVTPLECTTRTYFPTIKYFHGLHPLGSAVYIGSENDHHYLVVEMSITTVEYWYTVLWKK